MAVLASTDSKIIDVEVAAQRPRPKGDKRSLRGSLGSTGHFVIIRVVHIARVHLLVQNPGVGRARVEQGPYFLGRLVAYVDVSHIREIHMVI